jgi:hypothetical protein
MRMFSNGSVPVAFPQKRQEWKSSPHFGSISLAGADRVQLRFGNDVPWKRLNQELQQPGTNAVFSNPTPFSDGRVLKVNKCIGDNTSQIPMAPSMDQPVRGGDSNHSQIYTFEESQHDEHPARIELLRTNGIWTMWRLIS